MRHCRVRQLADHESSLDKHDGLCPGGGGHRRGLDQGSKRGNSGAILHRQLQSRRTPFTEENLPDRYLHWDTTWWGSHTY